MKLTIETICCALPEEMARNVSLSPELPPPVGSGHLAIVGGGPSVVDHVDDLRAWRGDIWAINGAHAWCLSRGINAAFMSVDPLPVVAGLVRGATKAVLADHCAPEVFEALRGATVSKLTGEIEGPTSAVAAAKSAVNAGYDRVTYFGCEGSFTERTHVYEEQLPDDLVRVSCDGPHLTKLEFILQTEALSKIIRAAPGVFFERSGGFLRALVERGDYDVTHVSRKLDNVMKEAAA